MVRNSLQIKVMQGSLWLLGIQVYQRRAIYDIRVGKQYSDKLPIQVYQRWVVYDFRVGKQHCDKLPIQVYQCRVGKQYCD